MCGINGAVSFGAPLDRELPARQRDAMVHRGPDDSGIYVSGDARIILCSRRLAIQDLSPAGHMPMHDPESLVWIVLNGEIYNFAELRSELEEYGYRFHSGSDTEVVLAGYLHWGADFLHHIDGMFALAIHDDRPGRNTLLLARDRAGEKPLYYWSDHAGLSFASELKALLVDAAKPREIDYSALNNYLAFGYVPGDGCMLRGFRKLAPAHALLLNLRTKETKLWRYWQVPVCAVERTTVDADGLAEELEVLLCDSVRQRLVADVPVGILLSGGVDSSLVTAAAARVSSARLRTFTIAFPGHGTYDESSYAKYVAEYFGTEHHELQASSDSRDLLPQLAAQYDEPIADPSLLPTYMVSKLTKQHVTVALGGDGGDELFGGYQHYSTKLRLQRARNFMPQFAAAAIGAGARRLPVGLMGRNYLMNLGASAEESATMATIFDVASRADLFAPSVRAYLNGTLEAPEHQKRASLSEHGDFVDRLTRLDFCTYLPDDILVKVDRASMAVSLEMRAPLLARPILEFAFSRVPTSLKATRCARKILLRKLGKKMLPPKLDLERKQGFAPPLKDWLQAEWGTTFREILAEGGNGVFNPASIRALFDGQERGYSNSTRLFVLAMFELWRKTYRVSV
ncbi:MAG TPA: asparagine synthase (glutamine-hydrolyzing) [Terriglobales bacterium]|nr:asparagine synthase (glutamine-hydrolyzing) [Terriglobales bacterium]